MINDEMPLKINIRYNIITKRFSKFLSNIDLVLATRHRCSNVGQRYPPGKSLSSRYVLGKPTAPSTIDKDLSSA